MNRKQRILFCTEFSELHTGYSVYTKELLTRLHQTGKYIIAENSCYFNNKNAGKEKANNIPWGVYGNNPDDDNPKQIQEFNSDPINQFGKWSFDRVCINFKPDIVCIPENELIMTINGYKPIQDIKIGEMVLTHNGRFRKVNKTFKHINNGNINNIKINGCNENIKLTGEHPLFIYKHRNQTNQKKSISKIYKDVKPEFVNASSVNKGDLVTLPKFNLDGINKIKVSDYINVSLRDKAYSNNHCQNGINNIIILDEYFGRLIGYIISDGCIQDRMININFHLEEMDLVIDAVQLIYDYFGIEATYEKVKDKKSIKIQANSVTLCNFLHEFIGCSFNKNIPKITWRSNINFIRGIICGLVRGDGGYKKNTVGLNTSYKKLAYEFRMLCLLSDIPVNLIGENKTTNFGNVYMYEINGYGTSAEKLHNVTNKREPIQILKTRKKSSRRTHIINNYLVSSVNKNTTEVYNDYVYNLEVDEDNSYCGLVCYHNCDFRDSWMLSFEKDSPFRPFFKWYLMPAVDAYPQDDKWINDYIQADVVNGYTDWALKILSKQSNSNIKVGYNTSPAANYNYFYPMNNRDEIKNNFGLSPNSFIIGTVMRNQKRKLFDDLFKSFNNLLKILPKEQAEKTYLYCHTSYPDVGWNIPRLLKEYGVGHKVLFTYVCRETGSVYPSFFQGARSICPATNRPTANMPNTHFGVDSKILGMIMNCFDVYVQYANCEALGMPSLEATACGVPLFATDYSAMPEIVEKTNGFKIPIKALYRETETHRYMAIPDNDKFVNILKEYIVMPKAYQITRRQSVAEATRKNFSWDKTAENWMRCFDRTPIFPYEETWNSPPRLFNPNMNPPQNITNEMAVCWAIENILGLPQKMHTNWANAIVDDLDYGARYVAGNVNINDLSFLGIRGNWSEFTQQNMFQEMYKEREKINYLEQLRCGMASEPIPSYIQNYKKGELE